MPIIDPKNKPLPLNLFLAKPKPIKAALNIVPKVDITLIIVEFIKNLVNE